MRGEKDAIRAAIDTLRELKRSVRLVNLVTPEYEYESLTLESFNYSRKREDGVSSLYVELRCIEVREVDTQYTTAAIPKKDAKNPSTASNTEQGRKQSAMHAATGKVF